MTIGRVQKPRTEKASPVSERRKHRRFRFNAAITIEDSDSSWGESFGDLSAHFSVYLCGHLHTLYGRAKKMHARHFGGMLELEIPERAQYLRVLFNELTRIQSHLVWLGTHAMDIGALTVFLYCFREREQLLRIFEAVAGQRMMTSYVRVGGLSLEPPRHLYDQIRAFLKDFPSKIEEYEGLLQGNPIWMNRLKGVGYLSPEDAIALGVTGPPLRASGVDFDVRRDMPYSGYEKFQFNVPVSKVGDVWARYIVRMQEFRESVKICLQALDGLPEGRIVADAPKIILPNREQMKTQMESLIHHFKIVTEGFGVPAGEVCSSVEAPHGMMNYYVVSDGTAKPYRVHMRNPGFATLQALETMCKGRLLADVVAVIGSIDIVLGEIDR